MIPNLHLFFLQLQWLLSFQQCCNFSQNKCCKTYLGTMLPPNGRHWQKNPHSFIPIATLILMLLPHKILTLFSFLKGSHRLFIQCKITTLLKTQQPLKHKFGILEIVDFFYACLTKFKNNNIYSIKLATDFNSQPSYLLGERKVRESISYIADIFTYKLLQYSSAMEQCIFSTNAGKQLY